MNIAIVGAGIVGVTTAYELARDGHRVTVFEQHSAAAEEASFAVAGLLAPHLLSPWSLPGAGPRVRLFGSQRTLQLRAGTTARDLAWLWRWQRHARRGSAPIAAVEQLAAYSHARLSDICREHELDIETTQGRLVLLRSEAERTALQPTVELLRDMGVKVADISADAARGLEPGLSAEAPLAAALHLPDAGAGNCRLMAQLLRQGCQSSGVEFAFNTRVAALHGAPLGVQLQGADAVRPFDAVVVCAGMASAALLPGLGLRLPQTALYGYSVSANVREDLHAPRASLLDYGRQCSIARLGQRVRLAAGAELGRAGVPHHMPTLRRMYQTLSDWFPGGVQLSSGLQIWRGARTMLPDGAPVIGASGIPGLWLNTGHGSGGWSLAHGGARALADVIAGRPPAVPLDALGLGRF